MKILLLSTVFFLSTFFLSAYEKETDSSIPNSEISAFLEMLDFYILEQDPVAMYLRQIRRGEIAPSVTGNASAPAESIEEDFTLIMRAVREKSPALAEKIDEIPRRELLEKILASLGEGVELVKDDANEASLPPEEVKTLSDIAGAVKIADGRIIYVRLDNISKDIVSSLAKQIEELEKQPDKKVIGFVIDLRNSASSDYDSVDKVMDIFVAETRSKIPKIVLTSSKTAGVPELLALLLAKNSKALTIGEKGRGKAFPVIRGEGGANVVEIPLILSEKWNVSPGFAVNTMSCPTEPQSDFAKLQKNPADTDKKDICLMRASDLLIGIAASGKLFE